MRLRSILTVLGIGIGIGAILFLVSFGQGLQRLLITRITTKEALATLDVIPAQDSLVTIAKDALRQIAAIEAVAELSPVKAEKAKANFDGVTAGVTAYFVENNYFKLSGMDKAFGNGKGKKESIFLPEQNSIIVSQAVLNLLAIKEEPLSKKIMIIVADEEGIPLIETPYKIVAVLDDALTNAVYAPASSYPEDKLTVYSGLKVQVKSTVFLEHVRDQIIAKGFIVSALSDTVRQANKVFGIMQVILAIFGTIALMVAAIGMFNTMTIALLERTNEIGIMRAIGASAKDIWLMFLSEALLIGFLGGVSGIVIGIGTAELANAGLNFLATRLGGEPLDVFFYPVWFIAVIVIFSTLVAFITGFYPAQRAANLNPLDALRYK